MGRFLKVDFNIVKKTLFLVLIASFSFSLGYLLRSQGLIFSFNRYPQVTIERTLPVGKENLDFELFWRVWDLVHSKYFDKSKLIDSNMVYGAIKGMVSAIGDPYTTYLPPEENRVVQEDLQGSFEGVGIQIGFKGSQLVVIAPLPNTPAQIAGIKSGDFILRIKDESRKIYISTSGISLPEAIQAIRGKAGTKVTLTLIRENEEEPFDVDIVREKINVPSVIVDFLEEGTIAHVKILKFSGETKDEWENAVIELLKKKDLSGIILDLRNNPGGFLESAVDIASEFLSLQDLVVINEGGNGEVKEFRVERLGRLKTPRLVVLVNKGSASASEILAAALKDNKRAKLIGDVTFGKGTIQDPIQIEGNGGLHITIARWLTPSGFWVNEKGLTPDVLVADNEETTEDEQLQKALEVLKE